MEKNRYRKLFDTIRQSDGEMLTFSDTWIMIVNDSPRQIEQTLYLVNSGGKVPRSRFLEIEDYVLQIISLHVVSGDDLKIDYSEE